MKAEKKRFFLVVCLLIIFLAGLLPYPSLAVNTTGEAASWCTGEGSVASNIIKTFTEPVSTLVRLTLCPIEILGYLLKIFASIAFAIAAFIFSFILKLNFEILNPSSITYRFISTGWGIVRDITNLGFVLFIILIALATIIRYRDYEAKKTLPRLIGAAILVNFSLAIPTVFINFSHIVSNYFFSFEKTKQCEVLGENNIFSRTCDLTMHMGSTLQPQKFILTPQFDEDDVANIMAGLGSEVLTGILSVSGQYLSALFISVGVFVMICYAILFLVRFVALHFLLILAPITWLFWVIPNTGGMFSKWWHKFIQYVFFAPAALFFLFLVIKTGQGLNAVTAGADPEPYLGFINLGGKMLISYVQASAVTFVMFAFLIGGLIAAQSLSIQGASGVVNLAKSTGKKAKAWAQRGAKEGGKAAVASRGGMKFAQQLTRNKLTAPLGNYLAKVGGEKFAKTEKEADKTAKALLEAGLTPKEIREGAWKPSIIAAVDRKIQNTGQPLEEELDKNRKSFDHANEEYSDADALATEKKGIHKQEESEYNRIKNDPNVTDAEKREQRSAMNAAKNAWDAAEEKKGTAKYNKYEADKAYKKAIADLEEFEEHFLAGFSEAEKHMWKDAKFDLSKTPFAGSQQIRDRQVPEVSTLGMGKEIKRLEQIMDNATKQMTKPGVSSDEREQHQQVFNKANQDHMKLTEARQKLDSAREEHVNAMSEWNKLKEEHRIKDGEKKGVVKYGEMPVDEKARVWNRIQTAEKRVQQAKSEISKFNVLRTPAYIKKEKIEKEPKPKPGTASKAPVEEEGEEEGD